MAERGEAPALWRWRPQQPACGPALSSCPMSRAAGGRREQLGEHIPGRAQGLGRARKSSPGATAGSQSCPQCCHRNGLPLAGVARGECQSPGSLPVSQGLGMVKEGKDYGAAAASPMAMTMKEGSSSSSKPARYYSPSQEAPEGPGDRSGGSLRTQESHLSTPGRPQLEGWEPGRVCHGSARVCLSPEQSQASKKTRATD